MQKSLRRNKCTEEMKCKIGQLDKCKSQGCSWEKVFKEPSCEENALIKAENNSKKQKIYFFSDVVPIKKPKSNYKNRKRRKIYDKDKGICYLCNKPVTYQEYTIDHVIPKSKGGNNKYSNLRPVHPKCNSKKGDKLL